MKSILKNEELYFYLVPKDYIFFTREEKLLFSNDLISWNQINIVRPAGSGKIWSYGEPIDLLSSADFLTDLLWQIKDIDEKIGIQFFKRIGLRRQVHSTGVLEKRGDLYEEISYIVLHGTNVAILYTDSDCCERKVIFFQPSEQLNIYMEENDLETIKMIVSKYAVETTYEAYETGEIS